MFTVKYAYSLQDSFNSTVNKDNVGFFGIEAVSDRLLPNNTACMFYKDKVIYFFVRVFIFSF